LREESIEGRGSPSFREGQGRVPFAMSSKTEVREDERIGQGQVFTSSKILRKIAYALAESPGVGWLLDEDICVMEAGFEGAALLPMVALLADNF